MKDDQRLASQGNNDMGWEIKLIEGYKFDEVTSALQKAIRRSQEFEACYFGAIIYKSGYSQYLARRLRIIAHEDCGIANPQALIMANQMYQDGTYKRFDKKYEGQQFSGDGFLPYVNLILLLCRGKKTRIADEITNIIFDGIDKGDLRLEVNETTIDPHSSKGKSKYGAWDQGSKEDRHKRVKLWFDLWGKLDNETNQKELPNLYKEMLKKLWGYYSVEANLLNDEKHKGLNELVKPVLKHG